MPVHVHINTFPNGSTGKIMMGEHESLLAEGVDSYAFWGRGRQARNDHEQKFATELQVFCDVIETRLFGQAGFHSTIATKKLISRLEEIGPDVVHLHNLHGYFINVKMLFEWLSQNECQVEWTLHDCWSFTGHCAYFTRVGCNQWKTQCARNEPCMQLDTYPKTYCRKSCVWSFIKKREVFTTLPPSRLKLITPSLWLAELVSQSYLGKYDVEVRHNSIDLTVFQPTSSSFRSKYEIGDRFVILGVASPWTERKGLQDFLKLAAELDSEAYSIVLVGLSEKQIADLPDGVLGIGRTDSCEELAAIYSAADIFFNPTVEDNYPTVNLEAEACGTPVVTYDTGGCRETVELSASFVAPSFQAAKNYIQEYRNVNRIR